MFSNQFSMARAITGNLPPVCVYAAETAIQLTLTELNENLREIYIEAYTQPNIVDYIQRHTARELEVIFGPYLPGLSSEDFYLLDIGSSGMMRSYMAHPCNEELTLEKKISGFLNLTLRAYNVPREEAEKAIAFVASLDIRKIAEGVMHQLLQALMMKYQFTLGGSAAGQWCFAPWGRRQNRRTVRTLFPYSIRLPHTFQQKNKKSCPCGVRRGRWGYSTSSPFTMAAMICLFFSKSIFSTPPGPSGRSTISPQ